MCCAEAPLRLCPSACGWQRDVNGGPGWQQYIHGERYSWTARVCTIPGGIRHASCAPALAPAVCTLLCEGQHKWLASRTVRLSSTLYSAVKDDRQ